MKAALILEDGKSFAGEAIGSQGERIGEVILNTAVVGYQEMITDPANAGKILALTYPLIGNYGCAPKFNESDKVRLSGLIIKEKSRIYSNWQAKESFDDFVSRNKLLVLTSVDTRTLAVHLRQKGEMLGMISTRKFESKELLEMMRAFHKAPRPSLLPDISTKKPRLLKNSKTKGKVIAVIDLGITNSILKQLEGLGFSVMLMPYNVSTSEILKSKSAGLIISGGPQDDIGLKEVVPNVRGVIGKIPVLGISTGHQVLALALGARINRLKLGHRGVNYPVHSPASYKGEITAQNHSCVADVDSLKKIKDVKITSLNLNDRTVEEIESKKLRLIGTQYIPLSPGFNQVNPVFNRFKKMLGKGAV